MPTGQLGGLRAHAAALPARCATLRTNKVAAELVHARSPMRRPCMRSGAANGCAMHEQRLCWTRFGHHRPLAYVALGRKAAPDAAGPGFFCAPSATCTTAMAAPRARTAACCRGASVVPARAPGGGGPLVQLATALALPARTAAHVACRCARRTGRGAAVRWTSRRSRPVVVPARALPERAVRAPCEDPLTRPLTAPRAADGTVRRPLHRCTSWRIGCAGATRRGLRRRGAAAVGGAT